MEGTHRVQLTNLYVRVLWHLANHPRISQETLARRLEVTLRTVQRHLADLEEEGYIRIDRESKPFAYLVDWAKTWSAESGTQLILLHPEVVEVLRGLSTTALEAYHQAVIDGLNPDEALRLLFLPATPPVPVS